MATAQTNAERPKYQVTEKCFLIDRIYDPETMPIIERSGEVDEDGNQMPDQRKPLLVVFDGIPNYAMKPVNDAARAVVEKHKNKAGVVTPDNPIEALTLQHGASAVPQRV